MEPIKRNANRMLDTLTGKIPEKISMENSFEPLPTLQEIDSTNNGSSSSILESIKNNWLALLAGLLLIMFTVFNVLAYYSQEKGESTETTDKMFKSFEDAYKYIRDSISKFSEPSNEEEPDLEKTVVKSESPITNQIPNITSGKVSGKVVKKHVAKRTGEEEEEEEEDPNVAINTLDTALANASQKKDDKSTYQANDSYSSVHTVKAKAGWCFVGEERGFRNCVEVGENDKCLSGDIFPTSQVCINPSLRA